MTNAPLTEDNMMFIEWKEVYYRENAENLSLNASYNSISWCNSNTLLEINNGSQVFKEQDVWTFYISSRELKIWFNGKLTVDESKYGEREDCDLWKNSLDTMKTLSGPVQAFRRYESFNGNSFPGLSLCPLCVLLFYI